MKKLILTLTFLLGSLCSVTSDAVATTYQFLPYPNALRTSGGIHGGGKGSYSIEGQFGLSVDLGASVASFDQVNATISEEILFIDYNEGYISTDSLDVLFHMTKLASTYVNDSEIRFELRRNNPTFPFADILVVVTYMNNSVHLTGGFCEAVYDGYCYHLDAVAFGFHKTYYVGAVNGDDNNDGLTPETAFATIQKGIDTAQDSDTIIVYPGLYTETINFLGKNITLKSTVPTNSLIVKSTTITGMVVFRGTEDSNCTLTGFNIDGYITGFDSDIDPNGENHTHATISHCVLENFWTGCGQLIYACDGTISNCVIAKVYHYCLVPWPMAAQIKGCHGLIKNCTIADIPDGIDILEGGTCTIENSILYHRASVIVRNGATLNISYCDLEGGRDRIWGNGIVNWGPGNIDTDPCFARLGDFQIEGDYHLKSQAGRWNPNSQTWVQDNVTSLCIDAGDHMSPIGLEPFPNGGRINMGAFGGTAEASKSYFGRPVCETIVAGDINGDCEVNFKDFALMALHWLECIGPNQGQRHLVEDDTEDSYSCEGNFDVSYPCSNAVDEDWDTYALPADGGAASCIYENYIIPSGTAMAEFTIKYRQTAAVTPGLCTNVTDYWDGSTWKELNCTALTNQISTLTVRIPDDALSRSTLQLRTRIWKSLDVPGSGSGMYYEGKVIWSLLPVCQNIVAGDVNGG